jgi:hypothetical protein
MSIGFYSLEDTKERLHKTKEELQALARSGRLNAIEEGDTLWFSAADVDDLGNASRPESQPIVLEEVAPPKAVPAPPKPAASPDPAAKAPPPPSVKAAPTSAPGAPAPAAPKAPAPPKPDITEVKIELEPEEEAPPPDGMSKIKAFGGGGITAGKAGHGTEHLHRQLHQIEASATRCRTFHGKLNDASLAYLDNQINEWIDANPDVGIKFANTCIGVVEGKHAESHLIVTVFY